MNDYQRELCEGASRALTRAWAALRDAEHDLFQVEGMEFHHCVYVSIQQQINDLAQAYYAASKRQANDRA